MGIEGSRAKWRMVQRRGGYPSGYESPFAKIARESKETNNLNNNIMPEQCQHCGAPLKTIPAGVSNKTGKSYDSFTACSAKCPGSQTKTYTPNANQSFAEKRQAPTADWDKISWGKCKHAFLIEMFKLGMDASTKNETIAEGWADMSMRSTRTATPAPTAQVVPGRYQFGQSPVRPYETLPIIEQDAPLPDLPF